MGGPRGGGAAPPGRAGGAGGAIAAGVAGQGTIAPAKHGRSSGGGARPVQARKEVWMGGRDVQTSYRAASGVGELVRKGLGWAGRLDAVVTHPPGGEAGP